jgi:hypothetical protein
MLKRIYGHESLANRVVNKILSKNVNNSLIELSAPSIDKKKHFKDTTIHGTYRQIPEEHKDKIIFSVVRDPFDRYISAYLYGFWRKKYASLYPDQILTEFPHYPQLSFPEYFKMVHLFGKENKLNGISPKVNLGIYTIQFIQFFFMDPNKSLQEIDDNYISEKRYLGDMPNIVFLHNENLNEELYNFLFENGYPKNDIDFILRAKKVNVSKRDRNQKYITDFFNPKLLDEVSQIDKLIFSIFPEYKKPFLNYDE